MKIRDAAQKQANTERLKKESNRLGMDLFGVADIGELKKHFLQLDPGILNELGYGISLGVRLLLPVLEDIQDRPTPLYLHHYRQVNYLLDRAALSLARTIQRQGYTALPIAASQVIDWDGQKAHVSHKAIAVASGHGWLGRNNLLVHPLYGAQVRLVTILTDYPLVTGKPLNGSCGSCRKCLSVCPAQAIKDHWTTFDHHRCFELLRGFKNSGNIGHYICGICVKACGGTRPKVQPNKLTRGKFRTDKNHSREH